MNEKMENEKDKMKKDYSTPKMIILDYGYDTQLLCGSSEDSKCMGWEEE